MEKRFGIALKSTIFVVLIGLTSLVCSAETVTVFFDREIPQHQFAAGDVKTALEARNFKVDFQDLSALKNKFRQHQIIIALASDEEVNALLEKQGGSELPELEEQAYALRTTNLKQKSYWVLGGDVNGAMYGALQLSENINFNGLSESYNLEESAYMKKRGIKFNIPFDEKSPTYFYGFGGTSHINALEHVWDITFWKTWFDEMARHRFNVLSLWSPHPFTSMLDMTEEGYGDVKIENVQYNDYFKTMSMDEKIRFWQEVMAYGRSRGFDIYFFTWNIFLSTAEDKYGITRDPNNSITKEYMATCMNKFLETYPDLTGFGVTAGEGFPHGYKNKVGWLWETYGQGMMKYAKAHPERDLVFIHREHQTGAESVLADFAPLNELPNVRVDMSFKYSKAHCHTSTTPNFMGQSFVNGLVNNQVKTWLELRNDDFYFLHWGEPQFIRDYVSGFLKEDLLAGAFFGSDGWVFTRVFTSRNPYYKDKNALEIQKHWYMRKLWGRLMYNPSTSDELFKNHLAYKYPEVSSANLFDAWSKASKAMQLSNEQVSGNNWKLDFQWYPENWSSKDGFRTLEETRKAVPMNGSNLCSFLETAIDQCGNKVSAWTTAEQIDRLANDALEILARLDSKNNTELMLNMSDLEAMSNLCLYNAHKFRAAIYLEQGKEKEARVFIGKAYCYWKTYTNMMDVLYYPVDLQRNYNFAKEGWHIMDPGALKDYIDTGGQGVPACVNN